jgi:selenocysteine lyase/cysteine desulfurase
MEEQVKKLEELSNKELDKLDRQLKGNSAYRWLKETFRRVDEAIEKAKKKAEEKLVEALNEIPELTLHCSD